ncbi:hypothetical protein BDY24DRAFT_384372 [Mrakia frigida]|uniref:uncharacterized protein n=1 Tax=Mrakia frigida TaxID=29902 RepID=UPI003FCC1EF9
MSSPSLLPHLSSHSLAPASHALSVLPQTVSLLSLHSPFSSSPLSPPQIAFVKTVDAYVLGKDVEGRLVGWTLAQMIVEQGGAEVLETWGRSWVVGLMPLVGKTLASPLQAPLINLLSTIFLTSPCLPPFHRETTVPYLQKFALGLVAWAGRGESLPTILPLLSSLLVLHPPSLRPLQPTLLSLALTNLLIPAHHSASAKIYSVLHLLPGKTASPQAYLSDLNAALSSASDAVSSVVSKVFEEEGAIDGAVEEGAKGGIKFKGWEGKEGELKRDRDGLRRMSRGVERLRGLVGVVVAMLRVKTERPVPVPIGSVLALGLRLFRLTGDGQTVDHVDPTELALAQTLLPEMYMLGCAIVGQLVLCVKQNLLPHQTQISSYLIFLLEQSTGQPTLHLTLLRTLSLLTSHLPPSPAPSSASLLSRTLKLTLSNLSPLLNERPTSSSSFTTSTTTSRSLGKGKKRSATGADSLLTLESTTPPLSSIQIAVVLASLDVMEGAMECVALGASLRTMAVRVLVGLQLGLPSRKAVGSGAGGLEEVGRKVEGVLVKGLVGGGGSGGGGGTIGGEAGWVVGGLMKGGKKVSLWLRSSFISFFLDAYRPTSLS